MTRSKQGAACPHPASDLLPWYLNGSLEGGECEMVGAHLRECAICGSELDELAGVVRALDRHGMPPPAAGRPSPAPSERLAWVLAAVLVVPAGLGAYWALRGFPGARGSGAALQPAAALDLGAGLERGGAEAPVLIAPPDARAVVISFFAPVNPDARFTLELRGAGDRALAGDDAIRGCDALGRCTYSVAASLLAAPGDYALVVIEEAAGERAKTYRYPFRVASPATVPRE